MQIFTKLLTVVSVLVVASGLVYVARPSADLEKAVPTPTPKVEGATDEPVDNTVPWPPQSSEEPMSIQPVNQAVEATIKTNKGDITIVLNGEQAPLTVGNFVTLALKDFYDGTSFHRVIPGFMVQAGDPKSKDQALRAEHGTGGPGYQFQDEINPNPLVQGSVAMANSGPNTNGSQFFIVTAEATPHLDGRHTNFGKVISGYEIVEAISGAERDAADNPIDPIIILDVEVPGVEITGGSSALEAL